MGTHNIHYFTEGPKDILKSSQCGAMINSQWLNLALFRTRFMVPKVFEPLLFDCVSCCCCWADFSHY